MDAHQRRKKRREWLRCYGEEAENLITWINQPDKEPIYEACGTKGEIIEMKIREETKAAFKEGFHNKAFWIRYLILHGISGSRFDAHFNAKS